MPDQLHVQNGMLSVENGNVILKNFNPSALSLHALPIPYDPLAKCPLFLDKLLGGLSSSDKLLIQKMTGCFLFGQNPAQKIFFVTGEAGSGKSCLDDRASKVFARKLSSCDYPAFLPHQRILQKGIFSQFEPILNHR